MFGVENLKQKPIQLYHLGMEGVSCQIIAPHQDLTYDIYYYWILKIEAEHVELPIIPDDAIDLVLSPEIPNFAALYFPQSEKYSIPLDGPMTYIGTCFQLLNALSFFNRDLSDLKNLEPGGHTCVSLALEDLVRNVQGLVEPLSIGNAFDGFFLKARDEKSSKTETLTVGDFLRYLKPASVTTMAKQAGLSERQFRRIAFNLFGHSPKKIQRVLRLQSLLRELVKSDMVLVEQGYYDDSHMIKELKKLTGLKPSEIRQMAENYNKNIS